MWKLYFRCYVSFKCQICIDRSRQLILNILLLLKVSKLDKWEGPGPVDPTVHSWWIKECKSCIWSFKISLKESKVAVLSNFVKCALDDVQTCMVQVMMLVLEVTMLRPGGVEQFCVQAKTKCGLGKRVKCAWARYQYRLPSVGVAWDTDSACTVLNSLTAD